MLFPFAEVWWVYALFVAFVLGMLALDLGIFHRHAREVGVREAAFWSAFWISLAVVFGAGLYFFSLDWFAREGALAAFPHLTPQSAARQVTLEFATGFLVEKSLAVDNLFVLMAISNYFAIPPVYQYRVLFWGIIGALVFRSIFIALGAALMQFHSVVILFGVFLIFTGVKLVFSREEPRDLEQNRVFRLLRRVLPVWPRLEGQRFFVRQSGVLHATPLLVALCFIEVSDIVFAVDSVPAIFALTREPFIVFTSNIFAILGLRALFLLVAKIMPQMHYLKFGLAGVLVFVGLKMVWLNQKFGGQFPIAWSLGIIAVLIGGSLALSWLLPARGHACREGEKAS